MLQEAITATAGLRTQLVNDLIGHDRSDSQSDGAALFASGGASGSRMDREVCYLAGYALTRVPGISKVL